MYIENAKKYCPECCLYLPITNFKKVTSPSGIKHNPGGYWWCCMECYKKRTYIYTPENEPRTRKMRRRYKLQKRLNNVEKTYGLSQVEYLSKIDKQQNLCAICKEKQIGKVLCIDHDHTTGKVRGLLCNNCNVGLGNLKDNVQILQSAIEYLQSYSIEGISPEKGKL
jgi:hypothetical protein